MRASIRSSRLRNSALALAAALNCWCQLTTGTLEIQTRPATPITIRGRPGSIIEITSNRAGHAVLELPYGAYIVESTPVYVAPLSVTRLNLDNTITAPPRPPAYVGSPSLHGMLLTLEPAIVTDPLDFIGLGSMRLPLLSPSAISWTQTRYTLAGLNETDSWQPGHAAIFPDLAAISDVAVRGTTIALFLREPTPLWHFDLASSGTGQPLASRNPLPEFFRWFTRDTVEAGGPITSRADIFVSGTGQWASQTVPAFPGAPDLHSRTFFGNARGRVQLTAHDQLEAHFSGSRIHLSNWGIPAGIEAMRAEFNSPWGIQGLAESDHLDSIQVAWTHQFTSASEAGALQVRYGFSPTHLDTAANLAVRTRHELAAVTQFHHLTLAAEFNSAKIRNRFATTDERAEIHQTTASIRDDLALTSWLKVTAGLIADFCAGGPISWSNAAPDTGVAISPLHRLIFRAGYRRAYDPLTGRDLDYGNPASLVGPSSIDPHLHRPYNDEFSVSAALQLPSHTQASLRLFRRDDRRRLAALDIGVPPSAYTPVPYPFDGETLTVYAQNPATLGQDRYLLTNPPGLRELYEGVTAETATRWRIFQAHASFTAMKSWGPTNPGNSPYQNDPGVIGALLSDPNTAINATGHDYIDRAYAAKIQLSARLPSRWGGIELSNAANYQDGLPFAQQIVVTGLPQGPIVIPATLRGSPEGGNRAEYALNWNISASREFPLPPGKLRASIDILNVLNTNNRIQEMDQSGPNFQQRLPVALEPPRTIRLELRYGW